MPWTKGRLLWVRAGREPGGAIFVLRKRLGKAVDRNRLKRRLRHACRDLNSLQGLDQGRSLIVLPQPAAMLCSFDSLRQELTDLLSQVRGL
jgi:ribonuclease P protein component